MGATAKLCPVVAKKEIAKGFFDLLVDCGDMAKESKPGQFVMVSCGAFTLRRPISICDIDPQKGQLRLVFEVRGKGTEWLGGVNEGESLDILGPLGNGFCFFKINGPIVFVGGGIGVPPLLGAARAYQGGPTCAILGYRSSNAVILTEDFKAIGSDVRLATDDGSAGHHGLVTELLDERLRGGECGGIFACGPGPMLRVVSKMAIEKNIPCFVSMEQRMACGVGACLCCVCKAEIEGKEQYLHVCKNGPVFDAKKIIWN